MNDPAWFFSGYWLGVGQMVIMFWAWRRWGSGQATKL